MVTHDLREALSLADRLILLSPRPARVVEDIRLDRAQRARGDAWIEARRAEFAPRIARAEDPIAVDGLR